jgi:SAM-dependent methyltransferase
LEQERLQARRGADVAGFLMRHLKPGMTLLDCGCGPGSVSLDLAEAVAPGTVIGVDVEPRQIDAARRLSTERGVTNARFEVGSVYELPFPNGTFDAAFANTLLLHLREPLRALREIRRVLKPGGIAGIADGDFSTWLWEPASRLLDRIRALFLQSIRWNGGDPQLARHYRRLLLDAGFARSEMTGRVGSETCGAPDATRRLAATTAQQLESGPLGRVARENGWATDEELAAMAAEVRAWGERPDAFLASLDCAAVGWVSE